MSGVGSPDSMGWTRRVISPERSLDGSEPGSSPYFGRSRSIRAPWGFALSRLFFGIGLEEEIGSRVLRPVRALLEDAHEVAIYAPGDLHLTLAFLGEVEDRQVPALIASAAEEFRGLVAPELRVGTSSGAFPTMDDPVALWLEVSETFDSYGRLGVLRNRSRQVGFAHGWRPTRADRERPFRPHVTVARTRPGALVPAGFFELDVERAWLPVDVTLFASRRGAQEGRPTGAEAGERYRALASWPLVVRPG